MKLSTRSIGTGRPIELTSEEIRIVETGYVHNIPAPEVARHIGVSRQRIYYYYKKFKAEHVSRDPKPTLTTLLQEQTV